MEENKSKIYASRYSNISYEEAKRILMEIDKGDDSDCKITNEDDFMTFYHKCLEYFPEYFEKLCKEDI